MGLGWRSVGVFRGQGQQLGSGAPWPLSVSGTPGVLAGGPARLQEETPLDLYDNKVLLPGPVGSLSSERLLVQRAEDTILLIFS